MPHDWNVSNCLFCCFFSKIYLSCTIEDIVEEEVLQLFLTLLLVMNVQETALTSVDTEFLEFSFQDFLCLFFIRSFKFVIKNVERMYWDFSLFDWLQFLFPMSSFFVILSIFPVLRITLRSCCTLSLYFNIIDSVRWRITNDNNHGKWDTIAFFDLSVRKLETNFYSFITLTAINWESILKEGC